jgi:hypothetical protein
LVVGVNIQIIDCKPARTVQITAADMVKAQLRALVDGLYHTNRSYERT